MAFICLLRCHDGAQCTILQGYPGLTKTEDDYMRSMAAAGMDMDTSGGQSVVAHHPQWGGSSGVPVGPPAPPGPPHGARPVPHPPGLQPPGVAGPAATATATSVAAAAVTAAASLHQNGGAGGVPPMETVGAAVPPATLQATVPHCYSSPATLSYTREEGRGENWAAPAPARIQVTVYE